ncbi:FadR/GntR family transcriptional regulator [Clostridium sp. C105KSO13]|uniref:FadR/GntR family transcriptional regulator n=1 Tax=Clostridium sp. C105KSO13 TaxID=1776045 RepID=UPI0007405896|nr:GntR family transcriptional regulator [Clostridium sp. C105KSO13]CUX27317.1 HTH-type transcriptional regulator LutR [Clostridium sp. C105KSO13]
MLDGNKNLEPVEKDSLYLKIADSIYRYIKKNELNPGDKLPSERNMAESLQISRNSLREALRLLEARGVLHVKTGKGVYLNSLYGEGSTLVVKVDGCTLKELQELQTTLDQQAVQNAITRGTSQEKDKLIQIGEEMINMYYNNIYSHTLDFSFHDLLYKMNRNNAIHKIISQIRDERFVYREHIEGENTSVWLATVPQHLSLAQAISEGTIEKASQKMDEILQYGFDLIEGH